MARRDRYKQLVWLKRLPDDPAEGRMLANSAGRGTLHDSLLALTGEYNLWVEIEQDRGLYKVRCYPRAAITGQSGARISASYQGHRLYAVLGAAVVDYQHYCNDPSGAELSPFEVCRWVA